jgi:hypothetical protein
MDDVVRDSDSDDIIGLFGLAPSFVQQTPSFVNTQDFAEESWLTKKRAAGINISLLRCNPGA